MAKRATKNRKKKDLQQSRSRLLRGLAFVGLLVVVTGAIAAAWLKMVDENTLPIRFVKLEGYFDNLDTEELKKVMKPYLNENFFNLDIDAAQHQVEQVAWVDHVSVRRKWPDSLIVEISEQQPLARWQKGGFVNQRGEWFSADVTERHASLPELAGPQNAVAILSREYLKIAEQLKVRQLRADRLTATHRRSWTVNLDNGLVVKLGRLNVQARLQRFLKIYKPVLETQLDKIEGVDMRYTNGFAVRWKPETEPLQNKNKGARNNA